MNSSTPGEQTASNGRVVLSPNGPTGDWQADVDRPPLGSLIAMFFRAMVDHVADHIAAEGGHMARPSQLYVLRSLYPDGASVTDLAERCEVTKQAISQVLGPMEEMELVKRAPDPRDRRAKIVKLTKKGENALGVAVQAWGRVEQEWAALIGPAVMADVRRAIVAYLDEQATGIAVTNLDSGPLVKPP